MLKKLVGWLFRKKAERDFGKILAKHLEKVLSDPKKKEALLREIAESRRQAILGEYKLRRAQAQKAARNSWKRY